MSRKVWGEVWDEGRRKSFREGLGRMEKEGNMIDNEWKEIEDRRRKKGGEEGVV